MLSAGTMKFIVIALPTVIVVGFVASLMLGIPIGGLITAVMPNAADLGKTQIESDVLEGVRPLPKLNGYDIAIVDASEKYGLETMKFLQLSGIGGNITFYPSCENLFASNPALSHNIYIVSYQFKGGQMYGTLCVSMIQSRKPSAVVIGRSAFDVGPEFIKFGADRWISKVADPEVLAQFLKSLVK